MSTPSLEAKQAAERILAWLEPSNDPFLPTEREKVEELVRQAIDTATAKLREELERYKKLCAIMNDFGCAGQRGNFVPAHQQPSATTPDVEKIAQEIFKLHNGALLGYSTEIKSILSQALAQAVRQAHNEARAPLVEALESWRKFPHPIPPHCDECAKASIRAMQLTDDALTGIGEEFTGFRNCGHKGDLEL